MSSFKHYLIYSLSFFSLFSLAQSFDPTLLSELSSEQLEVVEEYMQGIETEVSNNEELVEVEKNESLVNIEKIDDEEIDELSEEPELLKYGYDFFSTMPKLSHTIEVVNPNTNEKGSVVLEGLADFFG